MGIPAADEKREIGGELDRSISAGLVALKQIIIEYPSATIFDTTREHDTKRHR
jgi:hypothetical protein